MPKRNKVLIVDDDKEFLGELQETLSLSGYRPVAINNSSAAVKAAKMTKPDVIMLDLRMVGLDGFQVIEKLRGLPETNRIPIIAMTGYFTVAEHTTLIGMSGVEACLIKPFNPLDAISKIEMLLSER